MGNSLELAIYLTVIFQSKEKSLNLAFTRIIREILGIKVVSRNFSNNSLNLHIILWGGYKYVLLGILTP